MQINAVTVGKLEYLCAENISVPHCFTTRRGGVSEGNLSSLNLGINRGDKPENVLRNFEILGDVLGISPENMVLTKQVHSDTVRVVDGPEQGVLFEGYPPCDALITNTPGVGLVVFTADCTPILLHDPVTGAVGAIHAGWRGTALDLAGKTVKAMAAHYGCDPKNIQAAIGPNIGPCCFETGPEVPEAMLASLGKEAAAHIRKTGEKYYVNLKEINRAFLRRAGVADISVSTDCTACQCDRFWSYRKVGAARGAQGAIIVCREGKK